MLKNYPLELEETKDKRKKIKKIVKKLLITTKNLLLPNPLLKLISPPFKEISEETLFKLLLTWLINNYKSPNLTGLTLNLKKSSLKTLSDKSLI